MKYRRLGKTEFQVSELGLGTWQVGGRWGSPFDHTSAEDILHHAIDQGIYFIDTADVYADGESEKAVGKVIRSRKEEVYVATKCGRRFSPHEDENYTVDGLRSFVEDSLKNMGLDCIDLIQLHCPPTPTYDRPEIFELFSRLKEEGKIRHLGVSVERIEEALTAITYDNVTTVQIIFNMFRMRPAEEFFKIAASKDVGLIVRVPLASGLLTGKISTDTVFDKDDHRHFNREGEVFDKGETFSGVNLSTGLAAVDKLKKLFPEQPNLAPLALRWILDHESVSTVIPGASSRSQLMSNLSYATIPDISEEKKAAVNRVYNDFIKKEVHHLW